MEEGIERREGRRKDFMPSVTMPHPLLVPHKRTCLPHPSLPRALHSVHSSHTARNKSTRLGMGVWSIG